MKIIKLNESSKKNILNDLLKRSPTQYEAYVDTVAEIINDVRINGDNALKLFTKRFDHADIDENNIRVTEEEIERAYQEVDQKIIDVIRKSKKSIEDFHNKQKQNSWFDASKEGVI
ncbi:MAG: histidinol dehydrogenase, partial [Herbinix sp.]|nr:histidinol dehydrogenase [Herbinix sp.]